MLQTLMLLGLGFLAASLIAFLLAPYLWRYAVHATKQHIRQTSPLTMGEIRADRDQLRAEHALERRKLELERDEIDKKNKSLKIEIAELKKRIREISQDISAHGSEIKTKDSLLNTLSEERDRLKTTLTTKEENLKETQNNLRKEKVLSKRSTTALREANKEIKTKEIELKKLKKSVEKTGKAQEMASGKLKGIEGHLARLETCSDAVKNLSDELLTMQKECEKFLRTKFGTNKDFNTSRKKLLKNISGLSSLEKSIRKQWTIASKAESGGRKLFTPLKGQIDYTKNAILVIQKIVEKAEFKEAKIGKKSTVKRSLSDEKPEEELSQRIRSLQDKLSA